MVITLIITAFSQKLKMSLAGKVILEIQTAIVAHNVRGARGCSSLGQD